MSFSKAPSPGDISYRLGACLAKEEEAIANGDLETAANVQGIYADYLSAFMTPKEWGVYEAMPGYATCSSLPGCQDQEHDPACGGDSRAREQVHADLSARRRYLLRIARENNKWGRSEEEIGDSSGLDEVMEEPA